MTALINLPRAAWKRQPPGHVQVNAANGLTQGLISLYHAPTDRDLVLNRQAFGYKATSPYFESRGVKSVTDRGVAAPANAALATAVNGFPGLQPIAVTMLQLQRFASSGTYTSSSNAGWANGGYNLGVRYSSANFFPFAGVGLEQAVSLKDDRWHWLGVSNNSTGQAIAWKDGRAVVTNNSAAAVSYSGLTNGYDAFYVNTKVPCVLSAVWNRALSAEEHAELYKNPWQLFQSAPSRFYLIPSSGGVLTLIVQNGSHSHSVDAPSLIQAHVLALADSLHGHSVESPILYQAYALTLAAAAHAHNADNLNLSQAQSIAVADTAHGHSVDSIALTQAHILATADTAHSHSAEAPTLAAGLSLSPADATHGHTADTPALIQAHILSLSDATHSHSAESVSMGQGYTLTIADTAHSHTAEAPTMTVAFVLAIQDALHSQAADELSLATQVTLVVSDALHAHLAGSASEITLPTGDRIFLVAHEDRLFLVANSDRLFGV